MAWYDILAGVTDSIKNLATSGYSVYQDQRDYNYQKNLQNEIFNREDNAVQRRMNDLTAAGLNPNLAAGSAADVGSVVGRSSSQHISDPGSALDTVSALNQIKSQKNQIDIENKQKSLLDEQINQYRYGNNMMRFNNRLNKMITLNQLGFNVKPMVDYYNAGDISFELSGNEYKNNTGSYYLTPTSTNLYFLANSLDAQKLLNSANILQFQDRSKIYSGLILPTLETISGGVGAAARMVGAVNQ